MTISIRATQESDSPALSYICLATAAAGKSAVHLHNYGDFPGLVYAEPYVKLRTSCGFVMVDDEKDNQVVGYILSATNTREFEEHANKEWWPVLREKYPEEKIVETGKPADIKYAGLFKNKPLEPDWVLAFSPAHMHINVLEEYQRKGWGRKLIARMVEHLKGLGLDGVWLGLDPANEDARLFYGKLGFKKIDDAEDNVLGLKFVDFRG